MSFKFRTAAEIDWSEKKPSRGPEFAESWDDAAKERLCRDLLAEFGINDIRETSPGELTHPCQLPFSNHRNQDKSPTASLNYRRLAFNCLGTCQAGGGLTWFVGVMRETSEEEARKWLREWSGEEEGTESLLDFFNKLYSDDGPLEEPIPKMSPSVIQPWVQTMQENIEFFHDIMSEKWRIPLDNLIKYKVGVGEFKFRSGESFGSSMRYVLPHFWRGELVGWQTRRIGDDGSPKYLSSTSLPKDRTVFSYHPREPEVVVVESPMSVISKGHLLPVEATIGAKLPDRQLRLLSMHSHVIVFADNDEAGVKMTRRIGKELADYSSVWVAPNPYDADPADLDDDTYLSILDRRVPFSLWEPPRELEKI